MFRTQGEYISWLIQTAVGKYLADNSKVTGITDNELDKAFQNCIVPPQPVHYPRIRAEIYRIARGG